VHISSKGLELCLEHSGLGFNMTKSFDFAVASASSSITEYSICYKSYSAAIVSIGFVAVTMVMAATATTADSVSRIMAGRSSSFVFSCCSKTVN
jgi:hypothetical protein